MALERIVSNQSQGVEEDRFNWSLRPQTLEEYIGQARLVERLRIAIEAARQRGETLDHVLLHGPPGLGKTTIAYVIANEMQSQVHVTSGPALTKAGDLVGIFTRLKKGDVLFIDEIHRLPAAVEEYIYPAMEDYRIDVSIDSGMHARSVPIEIAPFCLIGATTRTGLVTSPLRSRFGITHQFEFYNLDDLMSILVRSASKLNVTIGGNTTCLESLARRSRGTPRIVNRLLRRVRDYAQVHNKGVVTQTIVDEALTLEGVDGRGLDHLDRAYLHALSRSFGGGPAGVEAVAASLGESPDTLEDVVEPFLLQSGLITRTRRGRQLTETGQASLANH